MQSLPGKSLQIVFEIFRFSLHQSRSLSPSINQYVLSNDHLYQAVFALVRRYWPGESLSREYSVRIDLA